MGKAFKGWAERFAEKGTRVIQYPSETLVRLMKGNYIPGFDKNHEGKKVLEIGFAYGANLVFMKTLGLDVYGIEVHPDICQKAMERLSESGIAAVLKPGNNREIPFADGMFDYLVSWDTLHYETSAEHIDLALKEFRRVLKKDGRIFLSTVAPAHTILVEAEKLDEHRYRIQEETFRKGEIFFSLETYPFIRERFSVCFKEILIGRTTIDLFHSVNDCYVVTAVAR